MPSISGTTFVSNNASLTQTGILSSIPIVLQNITTGVGLAVLSDSTGAYTFNNVPAGSYRLVESWGYQGGVTTPADFSTATTITIPDGVDPPPSQGTNLPAGTGYLASVNVNTRFVTVAAANITNQTFIDAPYKDIPLVVQDVNYVGSNIFTAGNFGDWGTLPAGTPIGTAPTTAPYPGLVSGFTYINNGNLSTANTYTVSNLFLFGGYTADHTTGMETGRLAGINGGTVGAVYYSETVTVKPNTFYQLSNWIINIGGGAQPIVGYRIKNTAGTTMFSNDFIIPNPTTPKSWNEAGTFFNSGNNTQLLIQLTSQQPAGLGNDFAVDDMSLIEATVNDILTSTKSVSKDTANIGDVLDYTVVMQNTGLSTITNIIFVDTIPNGTTFNTGTLKVNGTTVPAANPSSFAIPTPPMPMISNEVITVTYKVTVVSLPNPNPIPNSATLNYAFAPAIGGATIPMATTTNIVNTQVLNAVLSTVKSVNKTNAGIGDTVTYTLTIANNGSTTLNNIVLYDTIPTGTSFITDSLFINNVKQIGANPTPPLGTSVGTLTIGSISTITFNVLVTTIPSPNPFINTATFGYNFFIDPTTVVSSGTKNTNSVSTNVSSAILSSTKTVDKSFANIGNIITYTVTFKNTGNVSANTISFIDTIPNGTSFLSNSVTFNGSVQSGLNPNPPGFTILSSPVPLGVNSTLTLSFKVQVVSMPSPNPIPNIASGSFTYTLDPSIPNGGTGTYTTNIVNTQVNNATLGGITKFADKIFANCGETINYTIVIPNTGNVTAQNVVFKDTIPNGTVLLSTTIYVNGIQQLGANPATGIAIPDITPGNTATLTFSVQVQC